MSKNDDIVIPIMGPTGAGKSTFINAFAGQNVVRVGHQLASCTAKIECAVVTYKGRRVVLVDTPGFDDSKLDDSAILKLIADWLKKEYDSHKKLSGIIYMHEITQTRMYGSARKNLDMFGKLCGKDAVNKVILVTTKWELLDTDEAKSVAVKREKQLMGTYWKPMLDLGSRMGRFEHTASASKIIKLIIDQPELSSDFILMQQELGELEKKLSETEAGKALYISMKELVEQMKQDSSGGDDPALQKKIEDIQNQLATMKISLGRRFVLWFTGKSRASKVLGVYDG